ncbi:MAG: hypothetical protein AAGH65_11330 [Pseudomonadota bacterium]
MSIVLSVLVLHCLFGPNRTGNRIDVYFFIVLSLAVLTASVPIRHELFERQLGSSVERLLSMSSVVVDCNSYIDGWFYFNLAGFVYRGSSVIHLEVTTCKDLKRYLADPESADRSALFALHVLTHEAMHVAGEFNEVVADCQAFQRNHKMAEQLGIQRPLAATHAQQIHRTRSSRHPYYSSDCEPNRRLDERLPDAVWQSSTR